MGHAIDTHELKPLQYYPSTYLRAQDDPTREAPDKETLESLAALMGVDLEALEQRIEEEKALSRQAWKKKRKRREQFNGSVQSFFEVVNFQGKQLFFSLSGHHFIVYAGGKTFTEATIQQALNRLACE